MTIDLNFLFITIQVFMFISPYNSEPAGLDQGTGTRNSKGIFHFSEAVYTNRGYYDMLSQVIHADIQLSNNVLL